MSNDAPKKAAVLAGFAAAALLRPAVKLFRRERELLLRREGHLAAAFPPSPHVSGAYRRVRARSPVFPRHDDAVSALAASGCC